MTASQRPAGHDKAVEWLAHEMFIGDAKHDDVLDEALDLWGEMPEARQFYADKAATILAALRAALAAGDADVAEALGLRVERITEHVPHYGSFNDHRCGDPTEPCRTYDLWRIRTDWREA